MTVWVNEERTVLVRLFDNVDNDWMEVATREHPDAIWGPPVRVKKER